MKPPAFNAWVLDLHGYECGYTLDDLFPGSGGMGAAVAYANKDRGVLPLFGGTDVA